MLLHGRAIARPVPLPTAASLLESCCPLKRQPLVVPPNYRRYVLESPSELGRVCTIPSLRISM